jgi:hypothetical protein
LKKKTGGAIGGSFTKTFFHQSSSKEGIRMPKKKEIDTKLLLKMVSDGVNQKEIMDQFGFKNSSQLKVAYANSLMEAGQVPEIQSARGGKADAPVKKETAVNKRGSIVLPKALVADLGFEMGDTFEVRKSKAGVSLRRV